MNFFQRLFLQPEIEIEPKSQPQPEEADPPDQKQRDPIHHLPLGLHIGRLSDIGRERERNEDSFFVFNALLQHDNGQESFGLFIVADGMGGHQKGEVASSLATRTVADQLLKDVYLPYLGRNQSAANKPINEALIAAVERANVLVQEQVPEAGTTLTAALVMGNNAYLAHIGDTRAYLLTFEATKQITKDHSLAKRLEELGQGSSAELAKVQNVLYRAIGQNSTIEVDTYIQHLPPASSLLLCSDGLWGLVGAETIREIVNNSATPQEACERLISAANDKGGHDNITAVLVTVGVEGKSLLS
jgi:serine/threonine protein phosphatase PrpC